MNCINGSLIDCKAFSFMFNEKDYERTEIY